MTTAAQSPRRLVFEMARRPDLQGMRAVAVLAVFADHLFSWPPGGFIGVDVFFVLSGFFITGLLLKERSHTGTVSFQNFYVRRVKRIIPSALLVLSATVIAAQFLFTTARAKDTLLDALWAAVFGANIRFEQVGADYFQQGMPPSPIQHYWSLSIEEQFYFVWPWLLAGIFFLTRRLYRRGRVWARQWGLFVPMAIIVAASFGWAMHLSAANPNAAYFSTFTRVWELGVGALVAIAGPWLVRIPDKIRPTLAYLGLSGVAAALVLINSTVLFPAPWAALPVLSTAVVIASFHGAEVRAVPLLTNPVACWFGDTSYTLYLWHWPVIILLEAVLPAGVWLWVTAVTLAVALTAVTYRFYEDPIRRSRWLLGRRRVGSYQQRGLEPSRWGLIGALAFSLVVVAILSFAFTDKQNAVADELAFAGDPAQVDLSPEEKSDPCFGAPAMVNAACVLRDPNVPLRPSVNNFAQDMRGQLKCYRPSESEQGRMESCNFGYNGTDAIRIALVGDSHAAALLPALLPLLDENKWRLTTYLGVDCTLTDPAAGKCQGLLSQIKAELTTQRYNLVITTNLNRGAKPDAYQKAWAPILDVGSRIAVVADNPAASEESLACLTRVRLGDDRSGECGTPRTAALPRVDALAAAAQSMPGVTLIDLTPLYCTADQCPSVIGNVIVYRDASDETRNSHPTATFATTLAQPLQEGLQRALTE